MFCWGYSSYFSNLFGWQVQCIFGTCSFFIFFFRFCNIISNIQYVLGGFRCCLFSGSVRQFWVCCAYSSYVLIDGHCFYFVLLTSCSILALLQHMENNKILVKQKLFTTIKYYTAGYTHRNELVN